MFPTLFFFFNFLEKVYETIHKLTLKNLACPLYMTIAPYILPQHCDKISEKFETAYSSPLYVLGNQTSIGR